MKNQKGFASTSVLIGIIIIIALIAGGWWYVSQSTAPNTVQPVTQNPATSNSAASATINNTLTLSKGAALSGTVTANISSLSILVGKGVVTPPQTNAGPNSMPSYVLGEGSAAGGMTISNGNWNAWVVAPSGDFILKPGTYTAALYDGNSNNLIATSILTVRAAAQSVQTTSEQPSISIDVSSLITSSGTPTVSGSAHGLTQVIVEVAYPPSVVTASGRNYITSCTAQVAVNGKWQCAVAPSADYSTSLPEGIYDVFVSSIVDGKNVLTPVKGTLTVLAQTTHASISESATIDQSSLTSTSGNPTITGTASGMSYVRVGIIPADSQAVYESGPITIVNGRWSVSIPTYLSPGNYRVDVYDPGGAPALVFGTLTVSSH